MAKELKVRLYERQQRKLRAREREGHFYEGYFRKYSMHIIAIAPLYKEPTLLLHQQLDIARVEMGDVPLARHGQSM